VKPRRLTALRPLTASADTSGTIPVSAGARHDRIRAALASLNEEHRRLARLGFEAPLQRCRDHQRYWQFLAVLFAPDPETQASPSIKSRSRRTASGQ